MRSLPPILAALLVVACSAPASAKRARGFDRESFRDGYREILARWASGADAESVSALVDLEAAAVAAAEGDVYEALRRAELGVVRGLMSRGIETLVPLTLFHERVYLGHLERRQVELALHSRLLVVELAEIYAGQGPGVLATDFASAALTSLGGHLQEARTEGVAAELYQRAIELDRENVTALLALAVLRERHGDSDRAVPHLRRVLQVDAGDREAALRLAVNSLRLGWAEEGERGLEALAASGPLDWIRSLAFQELSRVLAARGDWQGAHEWLTRAVSVLPDDPSLTIQLAYVSERRGLLYPEQALIVALERAVERPALSPRFRYIRIPYERLDALRQGLRSRSLAYVAELVEALGGRRDGVEGGPER